MGTPTQAVCSPFIWRLARSPFEDSENFMAQSPRKRMRLPSLYTDGATNVTFQQHTVTREERANVLGRHTGYRGCTLWFTGLSGAGKTTIAFALEKTLIQLGIPAYGLDGDNIRHGLCKNLGFSKEERTENIRRVAEVAKLFGDVGMVVLASFISPYRLDRDEARRIHKEAGIPFFEIYVNTPIEICEARDPKKLYKKARAGQIRGFTGVDSAYERPLSPDLVLNSGVETEAQSIQRTLQFLYEKNILPEKALYELCGQPIRQLFVKDEKERSKFLSVDCPIVEITLLDLQWLQVLAEGWASPLSGFMRERQYLQSLHFGQLLDLRKKCSIDSSTSENDYSVKNNKKNNDEDCFPMLSPVNQSIPIVLPIDEDRKQAIQIYLEKQYSTNGNAQVKLEYQGQIIAVISDPEVFPHRKEERVQRQFGHSDPSHPGIQQVLESGDWLLGGDLHVFDRIIYNDGLDQYRKTPAELRQLFTERQSDCVFAFQLRNPIHNGHALLMHSTREKLLQRGHRNPMLLLHPLGGWTKNDDVPLKVRIEQHEAVIHDEKSLLDPSWTVLAIFPSPMCYAGPTEVQWHARARLACGVNAYIVGRDPAGITNSKTGDFLYEPSHGAKVLSMAPALPGLEIIPFRVAAYDEQIEEMTFFEEHRKEYFKFISGTMMRKIAREGGTPPPGFMCPKGWQVLASYYARDSSN